MGLQTFVFGEHARPSGDAPPGKRQPKDSRAPPQKRNDAEYFRGLMTELNDDVDDELDAPFLNAVVKARAAATRHRCAPPVPYPVRVFLFPHSTAAKHVGLAAV